VAPLPEFGKTGGNDHGGARSALDQLTDQGRHGFCRGGNDCEVRGTREARDIRVDDEPVNRGVLWIDQHHLASEASATQIARDYRTDRAGARAGANQCNGFRVE
jgi:hypothetical protein